jgi:pyruvate,water dikinase
VPPHLAAQPCIDDTLIRKLAKLAKKAEKKFGCPQDIEWAISDNKIFFLQSRPITSKPPQKSWQDRQVWTNAAARDVAPDVVTPATWSLMEQCIDPLFGPLFRVVGADLGDNPLAGLVAGRIYFNINTLMAILRNLPASAHISIARSVGGQHIQQFDLGQLDIPPEDLPQIKHCLIKALLRLPSSICQIYLHRTAKSHAFLQTLAEAIKTNRMRDLTKTSSTELVNLLLGTIEYSFNKVNLLYLFVPLSWLPLVYGCCRRWLGDENGRLANSLSAGAAEMQDVQAGIALWDLAQKAADDPALRETILAADNWEKLHASLTAAPAARDFLKAWDDFMNLHGHHCRGEILLFNPRWYETPDYILSIVKSYIEAADKHNPPNDLNKKITQREQLLHDTLKKLRNPLKRFLLKHAVLKARKALIFREDVKSEIVRLISRGREALLQLGHRLTADQILESPDDIFFLTFQELPAVVDNTADFDIRQTVQNRRLEYEKNKSLSPPPVVVGRFDPDKYVPPEIDTNATVLRGISTSPGTVTGPARVILRSDDRQHVLPGEILVAPFTDPGWTPYFVTAAGVVMDQGGLLSHGSIIAREFGIPAVVNVGHATKIIKTGQKIHLDANQGVVTISPQTPASPNNQSTSAATDE